MTAARGEATPTFREALRVWGQIGLVSFGGPAGQIALMHRVLVDEKRWLDERTFLVALNFCTLLPGPEAMQLATYCGWRLHGVRGGLTAGLLFILPGALVILALSMLYAMFGSVPLVTAVFVGIKAAVLAIVAEALLRIGKRALTSQAEWLLALLSFVGLFFFQVPFPIIILAAALFGFWRGGAPAGRVPAADADIGPVRTVPFSATLKTVVLWLLIWFAPLLLLALMRGREDVLVQAAIFFSKLAVVTFGGAYAVLAYVAQDAVNIFGWLKPGEMLDGLGLAETTPGPLILVTEFVGFLAGYRAGGIGLGIAGAVVTLWATFAPCFLFIFAGAPYIERLKSAPRLQAALSAITAAVVGVIFNLSLWFALHVIFKTIDERHAGALRLLVPDFASLDPVAAGLSVLAAVLLFVARLGMMRVLAISALLGLVMASVVPPPV